MRTLRARFLWPLIMLGSLVAFAGVVFAADAGVDPTTDPMGSFDQLWQAVVTRKWALASVIATMLFVALARWASPRIHGKLGTFINSTRVSATLAFVGGMASAMVSELMQGGKLTPKLVVYGFKFGVAAIGGYNAFWDILRPADKKPSNSTADSAAELAQKKPPTPPPPVRPGMLLPLIFIAFAMSSCGGAMKDTMAAELTLSSGVSVCYRTIDGVDKIKTDHLQAQIDAGDKPGARTAYSAYKPKIEAARAGCNTAADVVDNAEAARQKIPKGGAEKDYTNWLPLLAQGYPAVMQVITDIKQLVNDVKGAQ